VNATFTGEATSFVSAVPLAADGVDGDQAFITSGVLAGALYEKVAGAWTYVGQYRAVPRTSHPATGTLPVGFQWRLISQSTLQENGLYQWDGFNIIQIATDGYGSSVTSTPSSSEQYVHTQTVAAVTWAVTHNLGGQVDSVNIYVGGQKVYADVSIVDNNSLTITFASAQSGTAIVEL
jgi:hypothetical protein